MYLTGPFWAFLRELVPSPFFLCLPSSFLGFANKHTFSSRHWMDKDLEGQHSTDLKWSRLSVSSWVAAMNTTTQ